MKSVTMSETAHLELLESGHRSSMPVWCQLELLESGRAHCPACDPQAARSLPHANIRRLCENPPNIAEAAEKLGIRPKHAVRYARALARWAASGFPLRSAAEVEEIWETHCRGCDERAGARCGAGCGCFLRTGPLPLMAGKIRMATEACPAEKW